jgi:hypothetical protein
VSRQRTFTVDEANALLPRVQELLELIRESLSFLRKASASLPPGARLPDVSSPLQAAALEQLRSAEQRLSDLGIHLKDVETGLIDFPAILDGQLVLLCWREGEGRVAWYHDLSSGFSGRVPLGAQAGDQSAETDENSA